MPESGFRKACKLNAIIFINDLNELLEKATNQPTMINNTKLILST